MRDLEELPEHRELRASPKRIAALLGKEMWEVSSQSETGAPHMKIQLCEDSI